MKEMPSLDLTGRSLQRNSQRRTVLSLDQKLFGQWPRQHRGPGGPESPPGCLQGSRLQQWVPAAVAFWAQGRRGGWLGAQGLQLPSRPRCPAIPLRQDQNLSGDDDRPPRWQQQWLQKSRTQSLLPWWSWSVGIRWYTPLSPLQGMAVVILTHCSGEPCTPAASTSTTATTLLFLSLKKTF